MKFLWTFLICFTLFKVAEGVPAHAKVPDIRTVIEGQLNAFLLRDAEAAFSAVSVEVKTMYKTADSFMYMVKTNYTPLFFAKKWRFDELFSEGEDPVQVVYVNGPMGNDWVAFYKMVRAPNGSWKIDNVNMGLIEGVLT